jgi:hypothetical protein
VLFGQPELDETLAKPSLRQLRDRITHSFRMRPLAAPEVAKYLSFRMRAAGYRGPEVFAPRAVRRVARASGGLTRRINILADKSLLAAYTESTHAITDRHVRAAVADSEFAAPRSTRPAAYVVAAALAGLAIGAASQWIVRSGAAPSPAPAPAILAAPSAEPAPPRPEPKPEPEPAREAQPPPEAEPMLSAEQARRLAGYSAAGQRLLAERLAAGRQLLEHADDEHYALELFVTENADPARMERFLLRARELVPLEEIYVIPVAGGGGYRLWVLFGDFATREEAIAAARRLPPRYQQAFRAAPRNFGELRQQL